MPTWIMQLQSILIVGLMVYGITQHRIRSRHVKIMSAAMLWDLLLILQIELSRSAIMKAAAALKNPWLLNVHVSIAVTTVLLYGVMIYSGRKVLGGKSNILKLHRRFGFVTMGMRVLTLITSFMAVQSEVP